MRKFEATREGIRPAERQRTGARLGEATRTTQSRGVGHVVRANVNRTRLSSSGDEGRGNIGGHARGVLERRVTRKCQVRRRTKTEAIDDASQGVLLSHRQGACEDGRVAGGKGIETLQDEFARAPLTKLKLTPEGSPESDIITARIDRQGRNYIGIQAVRNIRRDARGVDDGASIGIGGAHTEA